MKFCKYHGLGNDYIVVDPKDCNRETLTAETVAKICDRHYGAGSDGILYGPIMQDGKMHLVIFNSDGSIAEKSGNGLRIFGQYIYDAGYVTAKNFKVETLAGTVPIELVDPDKKYLKVHMGGYNPLSKNDSLFPIKSDPFKKDIDIEGRLFKAMVVSVGNPHCVIFDGECTPAFAKNTALFWKIIRPFPSELIVNL